MTTARKSQLLRDEKALTPTEVAEIFGCPIRAVKNAAIVCDQFETKVPPSRCAKETRRDDSENKAGK